MTKEEQEEILDKISYHMREKMECLKEWRESGKTSKYYYRLMMEHDDWIRIYISQYNDEKAKA